MDSSVAVVFPLYITWNVSNNSKSSTQPIQVQKETSSTTNSRITEPPQKDWRSRWSVRIEFHAGTRNPFVWIHLRIMEYNGSSNTAMHRVRLTWTMINISQNGWLNREIDDTPLDFWTTHGYPMFNHTHFKETRILNSSMSYSVMCSHLLVCPVLCFLVCSICYFDTFLVLTYVSLQNCSTVIDNGMFKHCDPRMPWMGNQQVYWSFSPDVSLRRNQTGYMASSMVVGVASIPAGVSLSLCGCSVTQTHVWSNFDANASIWVN